MLVLSHITKSDRPRLICITIWPLFFCVWKIQSVHVWMSDSQSQIIGAMPLNDSTVMFLEEEFSSRIDNLTQVMGLHPHYLQAFLRCHYYLLRMDGPLPLHYRHYIAIMVQRQTETLSRETLFNFNSYKSDLLFLPGCGATSVFHAGLSACARVRADWHVFWLVERSGVLPTTTSQPQRD